MSKLLIFFLFVVAVAVVFGAWYWWQGASFSKEVLKVDLTGPEKAVAGEEVEYIVKIKNNGDVRLEQAEINFEYPKYAILDEGNSQVVNQEIGTIYPGDEKTFSFKCRLFGKEDDKMESRVVVTYQPKNLQAKYDRKTSIITTLTQAPLTFEFDMPLKAGQNEKLDIYINYFSNIDYSLENLRMRIEYPSGFNFLSASPQALDKTEWVLPTLTQANGGRVEISGNLEGNEGDEKIFKAQIGVVREGEFIVIRETSAKIEIAQSALYVSQLVNSSQNYTAKTGETLHYEVFFRNIGKKPVQKNFLVVRLEGEFFDLNTIRTINGDSSHGDRSIIWDWKSVPDLSFLDAGEEGRVEFWVKVKEADEISISASNPIIADTITIGGSQKTFENKLNSAVNFAQKVYYEDDVFDNVGPLPPMVGEKTTYTIFWQIKNTWNNLENVKIKTTLPKNVKVTGKYFPSDAKFTFDSTSKEVVWSVGSLTASQSGSLLTLAFQIEFAPDSSQKGSVAWLVAESELVGEDSFTGDIVNQKATAKDSTLSDDPNVSQDGKVK